MKIVGVVVEYNPFHNGHYYHLEQARKITNADYVIGIMSGNFVQRGIPAITDKYTRTSMALLSGADVIFELPSVYATASAEFFAHGAISILNGLNNVSHLVFGCENADLSYLTQIAKVLAEEPPAYTEMLKKQLKEGFSFPSAREAALVSYFSEDLKELIASPNNILGIEYLKALYNLKSTITPFALPRLGSGYNDVTLPEENKPCSYPSATALRKDYDTYKNIEHYQKYIPSASYEVLAHMENKTFPIYLDDFSEYFYYKLRSSSIEELMAYRDISEELACRIYNRRSSFQMLSSYAHSIKTKQYTLSRVQRCFLHILLNHRKATPLPLYGKLLGFKKSAAHIINTKGSSIPIISKTADYKELLESDIYAADLYNRAVYKKFGYLLKDDFTHPLIIL